jgi:hypothetical protein
MGALNTLHATNELYGTNSDIICCEYLFEYSNMNFPLIFCYSKVTARSFSQQNLETSM